MSAADTVIANRKAVEAVFRKQLVGKIVDNSGLKRKVKEMRKRQRDFAQQIDKRTPAAVIDARARKVQWFGPAKALTSKGFTGTRILGKQQSGLGRALPERPTFDPDSDIMPVAEKFNNAIARKTGIGTSPLFQESRRDVYKLKGHTWTTSGWVEKKRGKIKARDYGAGATTRLGDKDFDPYTNATYRGLLKPFSPLQAEPIEKTGKEPTQLPENKRKRRTLRMRLGVF